MTRLIPTYDISNIITDRSSSGEILISRFAPYVKEKERLHKRHSHTFYQMIYFDKGSGTHTIDFVTFPMEAGEICFMKPGQVHGWNIEPEADGYVINFTDSFFRSFLFDTRYLERFSFFQGIVQQSVAFLPPELQKEVKGLLDKILLEANSHKGYSCTLVQLWILEIFILVERHLQSNASKKPIRQGHFLIRSFQKLVDEKFLDLRLPKQYAALLFVSPNYLNTLSTRELGKPAGEVIRDRVLLEAKRLLLNAKLNISEIAYELNFTDHSHFSKFFKRAVGETPDDFRKHALGVDT